MKNNDKKKVESDKPKKFNRFRKLLLLLVIFLVLCGVEKGLNYLTTPNEKLTFLEFEELLRKDCVETANLTADSDMTFTYRDKAGKKHTAITSNPRSEDFKTMLLRQNVEVSEESNASDVLKQVVSILLEFLLSLIGLLIGLFVALGVMQKRGFMGTDLNQDKEPAKVSENVTLDSVIGLESIKTDIETLIMQLKQPELFEKAGAKIPKGLFLYGAPGTGKTLLAKAVANECNLPFYSANGSEFEEMFVGLGAKRVRDLFAKARKNAPAIIFIDEIDVLAGKRTSKSNQVYKQTLNQLLTEMDGFNADNRVFVIASSNSSPEDLDPALMREGRFDKKLAIPLPDKNARLQILKLHSKNKHLDATVDFESLASSTQGFSGAALESILNSAAITATRRALDVPVLATPEIKQNDTIIINKDDIEKAYFEVVLKGVAKKHKNEKTKEITAWHEAGHTVVHKLMRGLPVSKVTILGSSSGAGGVTFTDDKEDEYKSRLDLEEEICVAYAGRVAEMLYFKGAEQFVTIGASNDIKRATELIEQYLIHFGLGADCGMLNLLALDSKPTDNSSFITEAKALSERLYTQTTKFLNLHFRELSDVASALLDTETLTDTDLNNILELDKQQKGYA